MLEIGLFLLGAGLTIYLAPADRRNQLFRKIKILFRFHNGHIEKKEDYDDVFVPPKIWLNIYIL